MENNLKARNPLIHLYKKLATFGVGVWDYIKRRPYLSFSVELINFSVLRQPVLLINLTVSCQNNTYVTNHIQRAIIIASLNITQSVLCLTYFLLTHIFRMEDITL